MNSYNSLREEQGGATLSDIKGLFQARIIKTVRYLLMQGHTDIAMGQIEELRNEAKNYKEI